MRSRLSRDRCGARCHLRSVGELEAPQSQRMSAARWRPAEAHPCLLDKDGSRSARLVIRGEVRPTESELPARRGRDRVVRESEQSRRRQLDVPRRRWPRLRESDAE